jgi:lysophospholipase L1-like esterase
VVARPARKAPVVVERERGGAVAPRSLMISPAEIVVLLLVMGLAALTVAILRSFPLRRALALLAVSVPLLLAVPAMVIEIAGQLYAALHPGYEVVFLEPDRTVGWRQVPGLEWVWTGMSWYADDYSVPIKTNSWGFRDRERTPEKPDGVVRVAILGDSMIEALQVPLEQTAAQLLERRLNASAHDGAAPRYEVLNFGISSHGLGQELLVWETYARQFDPDYVFILAAPYMMERTVTPFETGSFPSTQGQELWIRPTFRLLDGVLVREPARDFVRFAALQKQVIRNDFGGQRVRRRPPVFGFFVKSVLDQLTTAAGELSFRVMRLLNPTAHAAFSFMPQYDQRSIDVGLKVIEELAGEVHAAGAQLVVMDALFTFLDGDPFQKALARFCAERQLAYLPTSAYIKRADPTLWSLRWRHDGHFNAKGNAVLADAMYEWMAGRTALSLPPAAGRLRLMSLDTARAFVARDPMESALTPVLRELAGELRRGGARVLFYVSPINDAILQTREALPERRLAERIEALRVAIGATREEWLDLHDALPREGFRDWVGHMFPLGCERVSEAVADAALARDLGR